MNVNLTPELKQLVDHKVQTGRYNSASEVVREALRLMDERDEIRAIQKDEIRKKIAAGLSSARAGRLSDGEPFMAQMEQELEAEIRAEEQKTAHGVMTSACVSTLSRTKQGRTWRTFGPTCEMKRGHVSPYLSCGKSWLHRVQNTAAPMAGVSFCLSPYCEW